MQELIWRKINQYYIKNIKDRKFSRTIQYILLDDWSIYQIGWIEKVDWDDANISDIKLWLWIINIDEYEKIISERENDFLEYKKIKEKWWF